VSEEKNQSEAKEERKLKDPRQLSKRPPSRAAKSAPEHVRVQGHGIRTTATEEPEEVGSLITELQRENFKLAEQEDFEASHTRTTGAGPNPYKLTSSRAQAGEDAIDEQLKAREDNELHNSLLTEQQLASHVASAGESSAADAEVAIPGETVTDTGQKIVKKPDRVDAQDRAVLERKDETHASAIEEYLQEDANADYRVPASHAEATAESDSDLAADKNPGTLYGEDYRKES
jgi:hypothetical protein